MTAKEVSGYLRIPLSSLWSLTKKGKIRGVKVGKHWRYLDSDIQTFIRGERRQHARINCEIPAKLTVLLSQKSPFEKQGLIRNLSQGGVFFDYQNGEKVTVPEVGDPVKIVFGMPEMGSSLLELKGRIVHHTSGSQSMVGIKFRDLSSNDQRTIHDYVG